MKINSFLSPSYWGSFLAFVIILLSTFVISILVGPSNYLLSINPSESDMVIEFYCTLGIVLIYLIRHYSAVTVQLYSGDDESIYNLPVGWLRVFAFIVMVIIVILASVNSFIVSVISIQFALFLCIIQSVLSLLSFFAFAICRQFQPDKFKDVSPPFKWRELILYLPLNVVLLLIMLGVMKTDAETMEMTWSFSAALIFFFFLHEWLKMYFPLIYEQLRSLKENLIK